MQFIYFFTRPWQVQAMLRRNSVPPFSAVVQRDRKFNEFNRLVCTPQKSREFLTKPRLSP